MHIVRIVVTFKPKLDRTHAILLFSDHHPSNPISGLKMEIIHDRIKILWLQTFTEHVKNYSHVIAVCHALGSDVLILTIQHSNTDRLCPRHICIWLVLIFQFRFDRFLCFVGSLCYFILRSCHGYHQALQFRYYPIKTWRYACLHLTPGSWIYNHTIICDIITISSLRYLGLEHTSSNGFPLNHWFMRDLNEILHFFQMNVIGLYC